MNTLPSIIDRATPSLLNGAFADFDRMFDALTRSFERSVARPISDWGGGAFPLDVRDVGNEYVLTADLPGVSRDDIDIAMEGNRLTISVRTQSSGERDEGGYLVRERRAYDASRSVALPGVSNPDDAEAELRDGVLTVRVKKDPSVLPRKIPVS